MRLGAKVWRTDVFEQRLGDASECLVRWSKIYLSCTTVTHRNHRHAKFIGLDNEITMVLEIGKNGVREKRGDMEVTVMHDRNYGL